MFGVWLFAAWGSFSCFKTDKLVEWNCRSGVQFQGGSNKTALLVIRNDWLIGPTNSLHAEEYYEICVPSTVEQQELLVR